MKTGRPAGLERLRLEAKSQGFSFLDRLNARCANGVRDTAVFGAFENGVLVAIGAHTPDDYDPQSDSRRMRHFFVLTAARRSGVGRRLASFIMEDAGAARLLTLRATHDASTAFWESLGFVAVAHPNRSHEMRRAKLLPAADTV